MTELERELAVGRLLEKLKENLHGCPISDQAKEAVQTVSEWLSHYGFSVMDSDGETVEL